MKNKSIFLSLVLLLLALSSAFLFTKTQIDKQKDLKHIQFDIIGMDNKDTKYSLDTVKNESTFQAMNELEANNNKFKFTYKRYSFGIFIESINGYMPNINKAFWKFSINGKESSVGVDSYYIKDNDNLKFSIQNL